MGSVLALELVEGGLPPVNGQIQYGSARPVTRGRTTIYRRPPRLADPARFTAEAGGSRAPILLIGCALLLGSFVVAIPREIPPVALATLLGGAWLSLVLAWTLPTPSERAGAELSRRLGQFRHEVNRIGDRPTRAGLESLVARARELELRDREVDEELAQIHATLAALVLVSDPAGRLLPVVETTEPLAPGELCHFAAPVRFGRRREDQFGHLMMTSGRVTFHGAGDVTVAWNDVSGVLRAGREVIVSLRDSRREFRFACQSIDEATQAGVIAQCLAAAHDSRLEGAALEPMFDLPPEGGSHLPWV